MSKKCRHDGDRIAAYSKPIDEPPGFANVEQCSICNDCGEWLSLGPSKDDSPEVQIEIRAAELAAIGHWMYKPEYDSEYYGALQFRNGRTPGCDEDGGSSEYEADELVGWLARVIALHEVSS